MSWRTNAILFVLAVGLSVYVYFFESTAAPWEGMGKRFRDLEPRDIFEIEISQPMLERDAESGADSRPVLLRHEVHGGDKEPTWWIVEPFRARALYPRVQGIAYLIADLERKAEVAAPIDPFTDGVPTLRVRFKSRMDGEHTIEVGRDIPDRNLDFSYVRVGDEVFATSQEFRKNTRVTVDAVRSRALFPVALPDAVRVTVDLAARDGRKAERRVLERDGDSTRWRLREPLDALADRELAEALVNGLNSWRVESFVRDDLDNASLSSQWGLSEPAKSVTVEHRDGRSFTVDIGAPVEDEASASARVYARHRGQPFLYAIGAEIADSLHADLELLRSRHLFDVGLEEFERLRATVHREPAAGAGVDLSRRFLSDGTPSWRVRDLATDEEIPGDRRRIEGLLKELRKLKIERFLSSAEVALPAAGLSSPWATIELWATDGRRVEYHIGDRSTDPLDQGLEVFHVSRPGEPGGYLVLSRVRRFLEGGRETFRNRYISSLDPLKVLEIEVYGRPAQGRRRRWTLSRLPGREWMLSDQTPRASGKILDVGSVDHLVDALAEDSFHVLRYEAEGDARARDVELTRPSLGFSLQHVDAEDFDGFRKLVVGKLVEGTEGEYHARVDDPEIPPMVLNDEVPGLLRKLVEHLDSITRS